MPTLKIEIPRPHNKQADFVNSTAKRRVIVAGRRGGKTTGVAIPSARGILAGRRILEAAPTSDQTDAYWRTITKILQPLIDVGLVTRNKTERLLEMPSTGGRIRCKTAWNADTLRGDHADLLILDEFSIMNKSVWDEVGAPMLLDNDGDAIFIFTPKRKNHAFQMFQKAKMDDTGRWAAWHFTSHDNPHLSKAALAEIQSDMTADALRQEIYAEFLDNEGAVFRNLDNACTARADAPEAHIGHRVLFGVDWGKASDYTAISALCLDCKREIFIERMRGTDYTVQAERVADMARRSGAFKVAAEQNSIGDPLIDMMTRLGVPVVPIQTTAQSKPAMIDTLALGFERSEWQWTDDPAARAELEAYEARAGNNGRVTYSAPSGLHDDTVMARAIAFYEAINGNRWLLA